MDTIKNRGVLIAPPKQSDYVLGEFTQINIARSVLNWSFYLPEYERQSNDVNDFLDCVSMSMIHSIEMQVNYLYQTKQLSDECLNFLNDNSYIQNGKVKFSVRYNAKMNGTDLTYGQYLNIAGDHVRLDGLLPDKMLGLTPSMTWQEYYAAIDPKFIALAQQALWFFKIQYQWINQDSIASALTVAPIQIASAVCSGWDSGQTVQKCSGQPLQHSTVIYGLNPALEWLNFDSYPPYVQKLAHDYELPLNMQYVVSMQPMVLRRGMRGSNVFNLQVNLKKLGYTITPEGHYGPITTQSIIDFQNKHGLKNDGIAGPVTLSAIQSQLSNGSITDIITSVCNKNNIPPQLAIAVAKCESNLNPYSKNYNTDSRKTIDRGLFQWNNYWHSEITDVVAFSPSLSTQAFCDAVKSGKLHQNWQYSQPCWSKKVDPAILKQYGIK